MSQNVYENSSTGVLVGLTSKAYSATADERAVKLTKKTPYEPRREVQGGYVVIVPQDPRNEGELITWIDQTETSFGYARMYCAVDINGTLEWKQVAILSGL